MEAQEERVVLSAFGRKLAADPQLAARCEAAVRASRAAIENELAAVERSEQLTEEDFRIVINATTEEMLRDC